MTRDLAAEALRRLTEVGVGAVKSGLAAGARRVLPQPPPLARIPPGRMTYLPGRGATFVVDVPGPRPDSPTVLLLHGLACTAYLGWAHTVEELSQRYRVVTFDQRWHGRGIRSRRFRIDDCADDAAAVLDRLKIDRAIVAGYSLGGAVAQAVWHRHPDRVSGLVLCSTARNYRGHAGEKLFFPVMSVAMHPLSALALTRVERLAMTLPDDPSVDIADPTRWSLAEFRSTSAWSMLEVMTEVGRFNSREWVRDIDVPTAVVVTNRDWAIPTRRQRKLAAAISTAEVYDAPGGHASVFLDAERWVPVFLEAVHDVGRRCGAEGAPRPRSHLG